MKRIYLDFLTQKKETKRISYEDMVQKTNMSKSKLQRIFTGQTEPTVSDLEIIVENGLDCRMTELYAKIGEQEMKASEELDFKGAQALLADFNAEKAQIRMEYETRIGQSIKAREDTQIAFTNALTALSDQYRKNADYLTNVITDNDGYMRDLLAKTEQANAFAAASQKRAEDAEKRADEANERADSAEKENRTTRKKMYLLFAGMLFLVLVLVALLALGIIFDLPELGMGNG